ASVVLAVMVLPIIAAVTGEVCLQTPRLQEEAALGGGATRWETIRTVVLPFGRGGIVAAAMLGLGRALRRVVARVAALAAVPPLRADAALALRATRWESIRTVVLPFGRGGIVPASMLGLGRALGETMAVLMILAPGATFSLHILEVGRHNSLAANIASKSAEASGVDMSLLIFTGLVLFVLTFVINALARWIVARSGPRS